MSHVIQYFILDGAQLAGLAAALIWAVALIALGAAACGRERLAEADLIYGWALVMAVVTAVGLASEISFAILAYAALALAIPAAVLVVWRDRLLVDASLARLALMSLPLIVLIADMVPSQWDEFTNWLPNARYLLEHDAFPRGVAANGDQPSPAYPYGVPLLIYLTSRIAGGFVEHAGALFNLLFYLCFAIVVARAVRMGAAGEEGLPAWREPLGWGYCALGGLAVTALNPTFVPKVVFTAYADAGTAVTVGLAGVLGWWLLDALSRRDADAARGLAWQLGLAATAAVGLKQANAILIAAVVAGVLMAGLRDRDVRLAALLRALVLALLLPVAVYAMWRLYVALNIEGGEFSLLPVAEWRFDLIPDTLARMALIASKKGGYFGLMLIAIGFGARALWRVRTPWDRLALIVATTFLVYNAVLLFLYVTAFGEFDALRAASYWRYNMHLGGLALVFGGLGLGLVWRRFLAARRRRWLEGVAVALIVALPFGFAGKLRFDDRPPKHHVRAVGNDLAGMLNRESRLAVIDPAHDGFYGMLLRYALNRAAPIVAWFTSYTPSSPPEMREVLKDAGATHAWVHVPTPDTETALGAKLPSGASYLLKRNGGEWSMVRSWPYPGYDDPRHMPD